MSEIFANRTFLYIFTGQIVALVGTGLATIALGLLAYDLAGADAALVLGTIFTIKMLAYVIIAPVAGALLHGLNSNFLLFGLNIARAAVALALPFVTDIWQIYVLIFLLQSSSAAYTPVLQAIIPDILENEEQYTRALSITRLAQDLENVVSPTIAALLLTVLSYNSLFFGTTAGFFGAAFLISVVHLPSPKSTKTRRFQDRLTRGLRIYLATPRLRGLLALNLSVAAAGALVLVNSVVLVRDLLGLPENALPWTMLAFGLGSMVAAIFLPRTLNRITERMAMLSGGSLMAVVVLGMVFTFQSDSLTWFILLVAWFLIGVGYSTVLTTSGRLLKRSSDDQDRAALYAAQFTLSHACWLLTYPLSGWLMSGFGPVVVAAVLGILAIIGVGVAFRVWPQNDPQVLNHTHVDLPLDHPHLKGGRRHSHEFVIDDLHPRWGTHI